MAMVSSKITGDRGHLPGGQRMTCMGTAAGVSVEVGQKRTWDGQKARGIWFANFTFPFMAKKPEREVNYMLENNAFEQIHYSRFIASWNNVAVGKDDKWEDRKEFRAWLKTLVINGKSLPESVIREICDLKNNGKWELEELARKYKFSKQNEGET